MADIKLTQNEFGQWDLDILNNDIVIDNGLETPVNTCLLVNKGDDDDRDQKWWGSLILQYDMGGKLYKYATGTYYKGVTAAISTTITDALQPLIDQKVIDTVTPTVLRDSETNDLEISIVVSKGKSTSETRYFLNWAAHSIRSV